MDTKFIGTMAWWAAGDLSSTVGDCERCLPGFAAECVNPAKGARNTGCGLEKKEFSFILTI